MVVEENLKEGFYLDLSASKTKDRFQRHDAKPELGYADLEFD